MIDVGGDAADAPTLGAAVQVAREWVSEDGFQAVTVFRSGAGANNPIYAAWADGDTGRPRAYLETMDRRTAREVYYRHVALRSQRRVSAIPPRIRAMLAEAKRLGDNDFTEESADAYDVAADSLEEAGLGYDAAIARATALRERISVWVLQKLPHIAGSLITEDVRAIQRGRSWKFEVRPLDGDRFDVIIGRSRRPSLVRSPTSIREVATAKRYLQTLKQQEREREERIRRPSARSTNRDSAVSRVSRRRGRHA